MSLPDSGFMMRSMHGCIAGTSTPHASIWNTESGAAYTPVKFGVVRDGVAASKVG